MSEEARGCVESLIRLHILQKLFGYVLRCTSSSSTGFIISSVVNKISAYGYIAQAAHYIMAVFLNELLAYCALCH